MTEEVKDKTEQVTTETEKSAEEQLYGKEKEVKTEEVKTQETPKTEEAKKEEPQKKEEPVKKEEIVYDLVAPEASLLKQERIAEIASYAKERGLAKEVAQDMVNRENEAVKQHVELAKEGLKNLADVEWPKQAQADKEIGGDKFAENVELAKRAFKHFGSDEFNKIINETGYGNHPEMIRIFSRIGRAMSDDKVIIGNTAVQSQKSTADILYGDK